ncbi:MAG: GGDEF domain-containing protein [Deltaproteobacteria bacterium]|nr:GGDEF domain-containing protein [Deltaproteobacteria bacterium]
MKPETSYAYYKTVVDRKTGALVHAYFQARFVQEVQRTRRYRHSASFLLVDIDDYPKLGKRRDTVARAVGKELKTRVRETDLVGSLGKGRFAILMPETSGQAASALAERLRQGVVDMTPKSKTTVSVGISVMEPSNSFLSPEALIELAHTALQRAKVTKNKVECDLALPGAF